MERKVEQDITQKKANLQPVEPEHPETRNIMKANIKTPIESQKGNLPQKTIIIDGKRDQT